MTHTIRNGSVSRLAMFALALLMALPLAAFADPQGRGRGRGQDKKQEKQDRKDDVFVNGHDARDGRRDGRGPRRDRRDDDDDWRRDRRDRNDDWRRNRDRDRDGRYGNNGGYGGYDQLRQTALNAGYNEGVQEGRNDRQRGERFEYRDESDYRNASKDYSSRLGDRGQYQQYFRQGFANGYRDGYNGY